MYAHDDFEPDHSTSPTGHAIEELELYGYRPSEDEADPRITPEDHVIQGAVSDIFDALISTMADTSLDFDLDEILWSTVNTFHRAVERIETKLDDNEQAQKHLQREQDGSEVKSVQLETLIGAGQSLIERRDSMEIFRETAADIYLRTTGTPWSQRSGSRVNHRQMTSAMIDSRDFINARKVPEITVLVPAGHRIGFAGGTDYNDHTRIWDILDKTRAKHTDMVLLHGGGARGAERIAACWAENRKVPQVVFKPDWAKHRNAAPFKRNDQLLEALPIGLILFPGSGIVENLGDKARKLGIPVWKCGQGA